MKSEKSQADRIKEAQAQMDKDKPQPMEPTKFVETRVDSTPFNELSVEGVKLVSEKQKEGNYRIELEFPDTEERRNLLFRLRRGTHLTLNMFNLQGEIKEVTNPGAEEKVAGAPPADVSGDVE